MRNEAQLAGVIAHESGHFLRRHMIRSWRDERRKTDIFAIGSMLAGIGGAGAGVYLGDYVQLAELGTMLSLFQYSREMEAEADAMGARLVADAGYHADRDVEHLAAADRRGERQRALSRQAPPQGRAVRYPSVVGRADGRPQGRRRRGDGAGQAPTTITASAISSTIGRDPADAARRPGQAQRPRRQPVSDRDAGAGRLERPAALLRRRGVAAAQPSRRRRPRRRRAMPPPSPIPTRRRTRGAGTASR